MPKPRPCCSGVGLATVNALTVGAVGADKTLVPCMIRFACEPEAELERLAELTTDWLWPSATTANVRIAAPRICLRFINLLSPVFYFPSTIPSRPSERPEAPQRGLWAALRPR